MGFTARYATTKSITLIRPLKLPDTCYSKTFTAQSETHFNYSYTTIQLLT